MGLQTVRHDWAQGNRINTLWPYESQHARPPCPSLTPGVHSTSRPLSRWCHPAISSSVVPFSSCPQSLPASVFSNESTLCMRWPKYWSFSFSIIPSKEHTGLISFRMDWLDLLAVQGTLKSLLQHHSSKASILRRSTFLTVQLSHLYMTTTPPLILVPEWKRPAESKILLVALFDLGSTVLVISSDNHTYCAAWYAIEMEKGLMTKLPKDPKK